MLAVIATCAVRRGCAERMFAAESGAPLLWQHREPETDETKNMPCHCAGGGRGHPNALGAAEGAAQDWRAHVACACAHFGKTGRWRRDRGGGRHVTAIR